MKSHYSHLLSSRYQLSLQTPVHQIHSVKQPEPSFKYRPLSVFMLANHVALVCHLSQPPTSASTQSVIHSGRASSHTNKSQCLACQDPLGARCLAQVSLPGFGSWSPPTGQAASPTLDTPTPYICLVSLFTQLGISVLSISSLYGTRRSSSDQLSL